ncbi:MAG TPA: DNA recombination protein RmuC, partial [Sphingomicrobium sp.]|nr:DNA recombination protein RmuC [Sphingomicrobium sp.]
MDLSVILIALIALALGALIGWLVGSRASASSREVIDNLRLQLDAVAQERDSNRSAASELAVLQAAQEERERSFQQQLEAVREAKESLSAQFHEIGGKLLGEARKAFLEQAGERF